MLFSLDKCKVLHINLMRNVCQYYS